MIKWTVPVLCIGVRQLDIADRDFTHNYPQIIVYYEQATQAYLGYG